MATSPRRQRGFTLLELSLSAALIAVLAMLATSGYRVAINRARASQAFSDIGEIQLAVNRHLAVTLKLPASLADVGRAGRRDPWGAPYQYLDFTDLKGVSKMRKDRNLVPINTDYDLYSMGPDGDSRAPLTAKVSRDDIVRANDGRYIGPAEDY